MSTEGKTFSDILERAGFGTAPEHHATNGNEPRTFELSGMEKAQAYYRGLREIRARLPPLAQWRKVRPPDVTDQQYQEYRAMVDQFLRDFERIFGAEVLTSQQPISAQRKQPN